MIFVDTSVISALGKVKRIDLLKIFDDVLIPRGVFSEILECEDTELIEEVKNSISLGIFSIFSTHDLKGQVVSFMEENKLGRGESEVILLATAKSGDVLMDEKRARRVARNKGIEVYGTLSLLKAVYEKRIISDKKELKNILDEVIEKGNLYVSKELYDWVLK